MRKVSNNYLKPQHYYNRLFVFFLIISISLTITINRGINFGFLDLFLLQIVVFFFLLTGVSAILEHMNKGEYMGPLEIYDVELFFKKFQKAIYSENIDIYIHKYDYKTKNNLEKILNKKIKFFLSTIRKVDNTYELTIINEHKFYQYFIIKFLARKAIHKLYVKEIKGKFMVVRFE